MKQSLVTSSCERRRLPGGANTAEDGELPARLRRSQEQPGPKCMADID
jgi:hypothetical protein